ncbi:hypothetical protein ABTX15_32125 [Micromonospora sp. NPDC094482]|uniref:hypothetical protein n=1 Tax=unclassified Micromonospora TaxID=2617518 RepID=UPI0033275398
MSDIRICGSMPTPGSQGPNHQALVQATRSCIVGAASDGYIRLIPTDLNWQPASGPAEAAAAYGSQLFSGSDNADKRVDYEFYEQVNLIDAGENTTRIGCTLCDGDIDLEWFFGLIEEDSGSYESLGVTAPCCGAVVLLDALRYDGPVGFARFEVIAMNPARGRYELDAQELAEVGAILGHPVTQVLAHY